jgi:hypothetical protein
MPIYERIGVGQKISFGLEVIDEESDVFITELVHKPASATYDPVTLTVTWKPTAKDMPAGHFVARITEKQRRSGTVRTFTHPFSIEVTRGKQPLPRAQPMGPVVENLITIHDADRLTQVNKKWPIERMLEHTATRARERLSDEDKATIPAPDRKVLFDAFLVQFADANANDRIRPGSATFDKRSYGDPRTWKIITVRPRLDKKWHELRVVYKAMNAPEPVYAMFRWRTSYPDAPDDARAFNNKEFSRLTWEAFFTDAGDLNPAFVTDKRAHARAVAAFVDSILLYSNDQHEWAKTGFMALPCESRLGGGSITDAAGRYESGDGWSWHAMQPKPMDGRFVMVNVPLKGFASAAKPDEHGTSWQMACADRFDPHSTAHAPGYDVLCRPKGGHTDLPATGDGYTDSETVDSPTIVSGRKDTATMYIEHKNRHANKELALRDPRRDLFEEKGMTCSQCHVRSFGVRDMYDRTAYDPSAGTPTVGNKEQATTYFVIVPTERWRPYAIDFQHKQECKTKWAFKEDLGKESSLTCPLMAE